MTTNSKSGHKKSIGLKITIMPNIPADDKTIFAAATVSHVRNAAAKTRRPQRVLDILPDSMIAAAAAEITQWDGFAATPLVPLPSLAAACGIAAASYKDESGRFNLGSFKALGGAYALLCALAEKLSTIPATVRNGEQRARCRGITAVAATDGNHGRSVAWGAKKFGCRCVIFIHANVSENRAAAMRGLGAEIIRIDGDYDASALRARQYAEAENGVLISDFSQDADDITTRRVMAGYTLISSEARAQSEKPFTHIFIPAGVGGLAAGLIADFWRANPQTRPRVVVVESDYAACLFHSIKNGKPTTINIRRETVMAGLSCGEVSAPAWEVFSQGGDDFVTIDDTLIAPAMRLAANGDDGRKITAGECAAAGWAVLCAAAQQPELFQALGLNNDSHVLLIGSEGATDPQIYRDMIQPPQPSPQ